MKKALLDKLELFREHLKELKRQLKALETPTVSRQAIRNLADEIATTWIEDLRSPLEHKLGLDIKVIDETARHMKQLHVLARPNNRKSSYLKTVDAVLKGFD